MDTPDDTLPASLANELMIDLLYRRLVERGIIDAGDLKTIREKATMVCQVQAMKDGVSERVYGRCEELIEARIEALLDALEGQ